MDNLASQCERGTSVASTQIVEQVLNILVVEDSYLIAAGLARQLRELGHTVVGPAASVDEALRLLSQQPVDAAILDISLGDKTTSEPVARRLHELGRPFLFLTGHSADDAVPLEFNTYPRLLKPVDENELSSVIRNLI